MSHCNAASNAEAFNLFTQIKETIEWSRIELLSVSFKDPGLRVASYPSKGFVAVISDDFPAMHHEVGLHLMVSDNNPEADCLCKQ